MTQQKLSGLQEALNNLARGRVEVLLDPAIPKMLPATIVRLTSRGKEGAAEALLNQILAATRSTGRELRQTAAACLVNTAQQLIGQGHRDTLENIMPALRTIAESPAFGDKIRKASHGVIDLLKPEPEVSPPQPAKKNPQAKTRSP